MTWGTVRVSEATIAKLEAIRESMLVGDEKTGRPRLEPDTRERIGLDQVIGILIADRERHARRRKTSQQRRRKGPVYQG